MENKNYTINQCYKEVEKLLKRPLNSCEFQNIGAWFETYPNEHICACIKLVENLNVFKVSYISSVLSEKFKYYQVLMMIRNEKHDEPEIPQYGVHL